VVENKGGEMKLQPELKRALKALVDELMVSFPTDHYECQLTLADSLRDPQLVRIIRSKIELKFMEGVDHE
jgi:hypothetical protein